MNTFFYTVQETAQATEVYNWCVSLKPVIDIKKIPSGIGLGQGLSSSESANLRNGDLLIVFVQNQESLESLLDSPADFHHYKIFLITEREDPSLVKKSLPLNPRHYSSIENGFHHTAETIQNVLIHN